MAPSRITWRRGRNRSLWLPSVTLALVWHLRDSSFQKKLAAARLALRTHTPELRPYSLSGPEVSFGDEEEVYAELVSVWGRAWEPPQRCQFASSVDLNERR